MPKILSHAQVEALFARAEDEAASDRPQAVRLLAMLELLYGSGLRASELRKATPWNTYVIEGLPPTPIANPGKASIEAAVNPAQTDYVFFVADGSGGHVFAETLEEHNAKVAKWRRIEAERAEDPAPAE